MPIYSNYTSRYEKRVAMDKFKENVMKMAENLSKVRVPGAPGKDSTAPLLIWTTTPPCECDVPIIGDLGATITV